MAENDDIESQAAAAAQAEAENPPEQRDDAPPEPKPEQAKPAKKKRGRPKKAQPTSEPGRQEESLTAPRRTLRAQHENRVKAAEASVSEEQRAALAERREAAEKATAERLEAVEAIARELVELHPRIGEDDEAAAKYSALVEQLRTTAMPGDTAEAAAQAHAQADELEEKARGLRKLYADLLVRPAVDDGRLHQERLKAVQARTQEIRAQRQRDRLKLLAAGAGRSKLDQAMAERPRRSPADTEKAQE